jgi:hypothetical protein
MNTITFDVHRKHQFGMEYFELVTFSKNEIKCWWRSQLDYFGDRMTSIIVQNKVYPNPTELDVLLSYNEARDLLGDEFEKVKIV